MCIRDRRFPIYDDHISSYKIGIFVMPVLDKEKAWKAVVTSVHDDLKDSKIKVGDVIETVDGKKIFDYLPLLTAYRSTSNDVSDRHSLFRVFNRPAYMTDLTPSKEYASIEFTRKDQKQLFSETLTWKRDFDGGENFDLVDIPQRAQQFYFADAIDMNQTCLLYTSPSPRDS